MSSGGGGSASSISNPPGELLADKVALPDDAPLLPPESGLFGDGGEFDEEEELRAPVKFLHALLVPSTSGLFRRMEGRGEAVGLVGGGCSGGGAEELTALRCGWLEEETVRGHRAVVRDCGAAVEEGVLLDTGCEKNEYN